MYLFMRCINSKCKSIKIQWKWKKIRTLCETEKDEEKEKNENTKNNRIFNKWRAEMIWPEWYWLILRKRRSLIIVYSQSKCFDCWRLDLYLMSRMNGAEIKEWAFKLFFFCSELGKAKTWGNVFLPLYLCLDCVCLQTRN